LENLVLKTLTDFDYVRAAESPAAELVVQIAEVERKISAIQAGKETENAGTPRQQKARALLDGTPAVDPQTEAALVEELAILREALAMQRKAVAAARSRASDEISKAAKPAYDAIVKRMGKALTALAEIVKEEEGFREALLADDVSFVGTIPPMNFVPAPNVDLPERVAAWHKEAAERGYRV
jgi:hypothetical protein